MFQAVVYWSFTNCIEITKPTEKLPLSLSQQGRLIPEDKRHKLNPQEKFA